MSWNVTCIRRIRCCARSWNLKKQKQKVTVDCIQILTNNLVAIFMTWMVGYPVIQTVNIQHFSNMNVPPLLSFSCFLQFLKESVVLLAQVTPFCEKQTQAYYGIGLEYKQFIKYTHSTVHVTPLSMKEKLYSSHNIVWFTRTLYICCFHVTCRRVHIPQYLVQYCWRSVSRVCH